MNLNFTSLLLFNFLLCVRSSINIEDNERIVVKYDFNDRCNNYALLGCDNAAAEGEDQVCVTGTQIHIHTGTDAHIKQQRRQKQQQLPSPLWPHHQLPPLPKY